MKSLILPGYSVHNKDWAEEVADELTAIGLPTTAHDWRHWQTGGSLSVKYEVAQIKNKIGSEKVNIIAKSAGVMVALNLVPEITTQINKIILCGIASVANQDRRDLLEVAVKVVGVENILCIQNDNDKYVPYADAKKFYHSVEPKLKVVSKPRSDHNYPYPEDFKAFLAS